MNEAGNSAHLQSEIDLRVRARELELHLGSRLMAALTCAAMAAYLAFSSHFTGLGDHSIAWTAALGLVVGALLGERLVFTLLGALVATELLSGRCA